MIHNESRPSCFGNVSLKRVSEQEFGACIDLNEGIVKLTAAPSARCVSPEPYLHDLRTRCRIG